MRYRAPELMISRLVRLTAKGFLLFLFAFIAACAQADPQYAVGYKATSGFQSAPNLVDGVLGDTATYYGGTYNGSVWGITAQYDLGVSPTAVKTIKYTGRVTYPGYAAGAYSADYSTDGTTWTVAQTASTSGFTGGGSFTNQVITLSSAISARYWRISLSDAMSSGTAMLSDYRLYDSSGNPLGLGASGPPSAPSGVVATPGTAQVALTWNASAGATSYNVKRSTTSGSGYATVGSPASTSYTDTGLTNGTTYYYVVTAVNANGESGNSSQVSATPQLPAVSSLSVAPVGVTGGSASTGTVTLSSAAPTGGVSVTLTSSNTSFATVPATVTVAAGATSATFTASTVAVSTTKRITITAVSGGVTKTALLNVNPTVASSLNATVQAGNGAGGNVVATFQLAATATWTIYDPNGVFVADSGTPASWTVTPNYYIDPFSGNLEIGNIVVTAPITAQPAPGYLVVVSIIASVDPASLNAAYFDVIPAAPVNLSTFAIAPSTVQGGTPSTGTVTLDGNAPYGGITVALASSNTSAGTVPSTVTVPAGVSTANFTITTPTVASTATTNISATYGATMYRALAVTPTGATSNLVSVVLLPPVVTSTNSATGIVTLGAAAPAGGAVVTLSSSNTGAATVPATVTIPATQTSTTFTVNTSSVASDTNVTISGTYGATINTVLTLKPTSFPALISLAISPTVVPGGISTTGTATLTAPAPFGGCVINLSSTLPLVASPPSTITVLQGSTTANFTVSTGAVSSLTTATISGVYAGVTKTAPVSVNVPPPAILKALTLAPTVVIGATTNGTNSQGTVTLTSPAPVGGVVIALASSNSSIVSVPSTVTVPAGATATTFSATTSNVTSQQTITITATLAGTRLSGTLTVNPWLATFTVSQNTLVGGASTTGTVTLNQAAPAGGLAIALASANTAAATIPDGTNVSSGVLTIPAGSTTGTFTINTSVVAINSSVNITASYSGRTITQTLTLKPLLQYISLSPTTVTGGTSVTGTVYLNGPAPAGGVSIPVTSDSASAVVPATVAVAAGASSATFTITTGAVTTVTTAHIGASYAGYTASPVTLTLNPIQVTLGLSPSTLVGGKTVTGTVTLNGPAPAGGLVVNLSSNNASAPVQATLTIAAGTTSNTFTITTLVVTTTVYPTITASYGGLSSTAGLTLKPLLGYISLSPSSVLGGATSAGTVTLNDVAPAGGTTVTLSSNNAAATVPANVVVAAGATTAAFTVTTTAVSTSAMATITGGNAGATTTASLYIQPLMQSLTLTPSSVTGGLTSTGLVTLNGPAPTGGVTINLTSSNTAVATLPATLSIAASATSGSFTITTTAVSANASSTISAAYTSGAVTQTLTQGLTVVPLISSVSVSPNPLVASATGTGTVTLTSAAPAGGITVTLTSSNTAAATVPASVAVAAGSSSATFAITGQAITANATTTISASYGGKTVSAPSLTVVPLISGLSLSRTNIVGGDPVFTGTISFNAAAPSALSITASSSNGTVASVPATVSVTAGQTSVNFNVTSTTVTVLTPITITVSYGGITKTATLNVYPMPTVSSLVISYPGEVVGGASLTGTVTLTNIAPSGGSVVALTSSNTAVATVPATVTVAAGATQGTFTITTIPTAATANSTITASYRSTTGTATVTVDRPSLTALTFSPSSLPGGNTTTGTVTISGKAPTGGLVFVLASSIANAQNFLPSTSITIPAGQTSATFQVATSTVNTPVSVTITAANYLYPTESVSATLNLTLINLRATDIQMPKAIVLQWATPSVGQYILKRDGVTIATLANTTQTFTDIFPWNNAQTYQYDLYDSNTSTLLCTEQVVPYVVSATRNQAVDSRLDPRYSAATTLNHNFGTAAYKGGLFAGYANDPSRIGRSFALFTLNPVPAGGVYRTGRVNAALISAYTANGPVSNLLIGCQFVPNTTWDPATLVWDNAPMVLNTLATQTVSVSYNPASNPPASQWMSWKLENDIMNTLLGVNGTNMMSVQWASMNEATNGWAYFAKNEYDATLGPNVTDLWSIPTLVKLTVPTTVTLSGAASTSATGQLSVNAIGLTGSAVVSLSSNNPLVTFSANGAQTYAMTVTGLNNTFAMTITKPTATTTVTVTATLGSITKTATITVNP